MLLGALSLDNARLQGLSRTVLQHKVNLDLADCQVRALRHAELDFEGRFCLILVLLVDDDVGEALRSVDREACLLKGDDLGSPRIRSQLEGLLVAEVFALLARVLARILNEVYFALDELD